MAPPRAFDATLAEPGMNTVFTAYQPEVTTVLPDLEIDEGEAAEFLPRS